MPVSGPSAFSPVPHHSWHRWKRQWCPKQPAQSQTLNPSSAAAALLLPAFPSSPERSPHPAVKSHRFVSNVQGTERSRVRQQSSSLQGEVGSCCCTRRAHPNIGTGLQAPLRVWKTKSLLLSLSTAQHSQLLYRHSQPIFSTQQRQTLTCAGLTLHISVPLSIHDLQALCLQASAELPQLRCELENYSSYYKAGNPGY